MGGRSKHLNEGPLTIPIERVRCDRSHVRRSCFSLDSLKGTIGDAGLLQPILVRRTGEQEFTVIDGARRLAAMVELGITDLIVGRDLVIDVEETEADARFKQIIANVQREDLNAIELGHAFVSLKEEFGYQYNEVAEIIGKTPHYVAAKVGLAKRLDPWVQQRYVDDLDRERCIQSTSADEPLSCYVMNVNVLEDVARLDLALQRQAYETISAREMDKAGALAYLRALKRETAAVANVEAPVAGRENGHDGGVRRRIRKIGRDVERLADTVGTGSAIEHDEIVNEIELLIEKLSVLCIRIRGREAGVPRASLAEP